jgi:hypothetical protein
MHFATTPKALEAHPCVKRRESVCCDAAMAAWGLGRAKTLWQKHKRAGEAGKGPCVVTVSGSAGYSVRNWLRRGAAAQCRQCYGGGPTRLMAAVP